MVAHSFIQCIDYCNHANSPVCGTVYCMNSWMCLRCILPVFLSLSYTETLWTDNVVVLLDSSSHRASEFTMCRHSWHCNRNELNWFHFVSLPLHCDMKASSRVQNGDTRLIRYSWDISWLSRIIIKHANFRKQQWGLLMWTASYGLEDILDTSIQKWCKSVVSSVAWSIRWSFCSVRSRLTGQRMYKAVYKRWCLVCQVICWLISLDCGTFFCTCSVVLLKLYTWCVIWRLKHGKKEAIKCCSLYCNSLVTQQMLCSIWIGLSW